MWEENEENGTGIETEINFFRGTSPSPEQPVSGLVTFFFPLATAWFCVRLCEYVCVSVSLCASLCASVKRKKIKGNCWNYITSPNLSATWSDCSVVLIFFWSSGPDGEEFEAPFLFFSSILPAEWKSSIIFPFSIVLFASVLLIMSHPDYLQLFPIATWLNFFYYNFFGGAFLSVLNILCRFTHLNGTVVFFCLFLYLFSIVGVYEGEGRSPEWHLFPGMDAESPRSQFIINQCPSWPVRVQISSCYLSPTLRIFVSSWIFFSAVWID